MDNKVYSSLRFTLPPNPNAGLTFDEGALKDIWLAGGCFWGVEAYFSHVYGVAATQAGYANGRTPSPTYQEIGATGHAETVRVRYDPARVPLSQLLDRFFLIIDSTTLNRQGGDVGTQYRTGIYYRDEADLPVIRAAMEAESRKKEGRVVSEVARLEGFHPAEEYHQAYLEKNPSGYCHVDFTSLHHPMANDAAGYIAPPKETLRQKLTPEQYRVTQENGTEPPFTNAYNDHHAPGLYVDIVTGEPLFLSSDKFDAGCGWPSFTKPVHAGAVKEKSDSSHGMLRIEVRSRAGDSHLGHVFPDGPQQLGGLRYCINSAALRFIPKDKLEEEGYGQYASYVS